MTGMQPRPLESAHFGRASQMRGGLLVIRVPATALDTIQTLEAGGALLCDVLLTLTTTVQAGQSAPVAVTSSRIRMATEADAASLEFIGGEAFRSHMGHWHADRRLPTALADLLYARWSADLARGVDATHQLLLAERDRVPVGFLALARLEDTTWTVTLTCVAPDSQGLGVFRALLDAAHAVIADSGGGRLAYETQITNHSALRAVSRAGFEPGTARLTFHLWMSGA